ncbi:hypothetical protein V6Z12_D11G329600 [Gossypium hirsutum]
MQDLVNLKVITLDFSLNLVRIPDLSRAPNLEKINLFWCSNLRDLPSSLQHLEKLTLLNVNSCENLRSLPSFYKATSLIELDLGGCSNLCSFPEIMGTMESLRHLVLNGTALKELPSSIGNLIGLKELNMNNCKNLVCLPDSFYKLKSLTTFRLHGCSRLEIFPEIMDTMEWLYELDLSGTALKEIPSSIGNLIGLMRLNMNNCKNLVCLPDSFCKLKSLSRFYLQGCSRLEIFPEIMDTMEWLYELDLSGTALKELPSSIGNLIGLKDLNMNNCRNFVFLPDSFYKLKSLRRFYLKGCSRLEIFPEILDTMKRLYELDLNETALKELPSSIGNLIGLKDLNMNNCKSLVFLPDSFCKLKSLERFYLKGCSRLEIFPEIMDTMKMLYELDLSETALKELPSSIGNLIGLKDLNMNNCKSLVFLPDSFCKLKSLERFYLKGCSRLEIFPEIIDTMKMLYELDLSETALKELPSSIGNLIGLKDLNMNNCKNLVFLPDNFYKLKSLKRFYLKGCSRLEIFPEIMDTMERLKELDLSGTALKELPSSIGNLIGLEGLRLKNCKNLVFLPGSFYKLKSLRRFYLKGCSRLEIFPEIMETMKRLYELDLSGTALKELSSSIGNLIGLKDLNMNNCKSLVFLPDSFYKLKSLRRFYLKGCSRLEIFPEILDTMKRLYELDLSGTALKELPSSIGNLIGLKDLNMNNCKNLVCLPDSFCKLKSLTTFRLHGCLRLEIFPEIIDTMERLYELDLSGTALKELPSSIDNLVGLKYLSLNDCENFVCFLDSFFKLKSLLCLSLCGSSNLIVKNLFTAVGGRPVNQKDPHGFSSLKKLELSESNLENLPTTIKQFPLHELILRNCKRLKSLPELPPSLKCLDAHACTSLEDVSSIQKFFKQPLFCQDKPYGSLVLNFSNCFKLGEKGVGNDIDAEDSTSLEEVSSIKKVLKQAVFCKSLGWLFTNCFQLDQKAASGPETPKLEMPFEHMVTLLKDYHQAPPESKKRACIITCVPGSEIPEWFDFKSLGSSMNIQLPSEWCSNNSWINFPSFVASAVVSVPDSSYTGGEFGITCECHLKSRNGDDRCFICYSYFLFGSRLSDHVFLVYDGFKVREFVKSKASNNRIYIEATFNFYLEGLDSSQCEVKQCGVHRLFAN